MARPGRKPLPEGTKKQKLTLTCKAENITYLNTYCNKNGVSISQLLDNLAEQMQQEEAKAAAKAKRAAKKAGLPVPEEQLPGQLSFDETI